MAAPRFISGSALHAALALVVAGCLPSCGGRSEPADLLCDDGGLRLLAGLKPSDPVDYLALYETMEFGAGEPPTLRLVAEEGEACATAVDADACQHALADTLAVVPPETAFDKTEQVTAKDFFVYTRDDGVYGFGDTAGMLDFLGPIDTPNEAALVLWAADRPVACDALFEEATGYRAMSHYMVSDCPISEQEVEVHVTPDGKVSETNQGPPVESNACAGRRPDGLNCARIVGERSGVGDYFAQLAQLELAAVAAFALLERELATHGAPQHLLEHCRAAQADEVSHTRTMSRLAQRFGASPPPITVAPRSARTLLDIALENAREGTVRELYGAAVAAWQAVHARDGEVRRAFAQIAPQESVHAWLSCELDAWLGSRLSPAERALVGAERAQAYAQLFSELQTPVAEAIHEMAGVPSPQQAVQLLHSLRQSLQAAA
jgi:hypothetical protein